MYMYAVSDHVSSFMNVLGESSKGKSNALRSEYHCSNHSAVTLPKQGTKKRIDHDGNSISSDDEPDVPQELMYNYVNHVTANDVKTRAFNSLTRNLIKSDPIDIWAKEGTAWVWINNFLVLFYCRSEGIFLFT